MNACHDVGLVYRDVKPDNIILVDCGQPKRRPLPGHLPREETVLAPGERCADCGGRLKCLGEDVTEELEYIPGRFVVKRIRRQSLKQDVRSDLSFAACIFHYLLGDRHPDILQDGGGDLLGDLALGRSGRSPHLIAGWQASSRRPSS